MEKSKEEILLENSVNVIYENPLKYYEQEDAKNAMQIFADQETSKLKEENKRLMEEMELGKNFIRKILLEDRSNETLNQITNYLNSK